MELAGHPFYVGTQAHPEFKSRPDRPHPLFRELIAAALTRAEGRNPHIPFERAVELVEAAESAESVESTESAGERAAQPAG